MQGIIWGLQGDDFKLNLKEKGEYAELGGVRQQKILSPLIQATALPSSCPTPLTQFTLPLSALGIEGGLAGIQQF